MAKRDKRTTAFTRKKPAPGVLIVNGQPTIVFVTVCTKDRRRWLATPEIHNALQRVWRDEATAWLVGRYVVMPDHLHFFAGLAQETCELETWMRFWKRRFVQVLRLSPGSFQSGHWPTRMRTSEQYEEKWDYVRHNPVRHGLVSEPEQWPFAGEIHELRW